MNHGSFGMVFLAKDIPSNQLVAVKCVVKPGSPAAADSDLSVDELSRELEYHHQLGNHQHIVNLLDNFETESYTFLVLEFCPMGDLYESIRLGRGPLETGHVKTFMLQLVSAVEHMHSRGVYHRDIKPENIFLTQDGDVKLGDFGLATTEEWTDESAVGSDRYMAPEQYDAFGGYSPEQADIWAIGICLLNILFSRNPFVIPTENDPLFADYVVDREALFDIFPTLSIDTYDVLTYCLALDPSKRSLAGVRDAIERVVSWTTDDESLDDFCTEDRDVIAASANREPLRTPSIQPPAINNGGAFPWAHAIQNMSATIYEEPEDQHVDVRYSEDMFKDRPDEYASARDLGYFIANPASYDSGLGGSFSSIPKEFTLRSDKLDKTRSDKIEARAEIKARSDTIDIKTRTVPTSTPFDVNFATSAASCSKSWSDWVMEDEEEEERERDEREKEIKRRSWSYQSDPGYADEDEYADEWVGGGWEDLAV